MNLVMNAHEDDNIGGWDPISEVIESDAEEKTKTRPKVYQKSYDQLTNVTDKRRRLHETQALVDELLGPGRFKLVEVDGFPCN